jgi:hypothetical protein
MLHVVHEMRSNCKCALKKHEWARVTVTTNHKPCGPESAMPHISAPFHSRRSALSISHTVYINLGSSLAIQRKRNKKNRYDESFDSHFQLLPGLMLSTLLKKWHISRFLSRWNCSEYISTVCIEFLWPGVLKISDKIYSSWHNCVIIHSLAAWARWVPFQCIYRSLCSWWMRA